MLEKLQDYLNQNQDLKIGLQIKNLRGVNNILFEQNIDDSFQCSTLVFLPVMLTVLNEASNKNLALNESIDIPKFKIDSFITELGEDKLTIKQLLESMIIHTDLNSAKLLIDKVGINKITEFLENEGYKNTAVGSNNTTTVKEMTNLIDSIYKKRIITPRMCTYSLGLLQNNRNYVTLLRLISDNVLLAQYTGEFGKCCASIGLFILKECEYIISVYVDGTESLVESRKVVGKISKLVYDELNTPETI